MLIQRDELFTVLRDRDLHDRPLTAFHYHGNDHLDLTLPLSRHDHRSVHLGGWQLRQWGLQFLRLSESFPLSDPKLPIDYII